MQITKERLIEIIKEEIANLNVTEETTEEVTEETEVTEEETVEETVDVQSKIAQIEEKLSALKNSLN
tara:strand:- start:68 stop:268 length:201 start_codon:yes stop_codon:yes gene_type:complete